MSTEDPSAALKKTQDTLTVILQNLDKDLAVQVVLSAVSLNYQKVVEKATTCSDLMYFREMLASITIQSNSEKAADLASIEEAKEHLKRFGYRFK